MLGQLHVFQELLARVEGHSASFHGVGHGQDRPHGHAVEPRLSWAAGFAGWRCTTRVGFQLRVSRSIGQDAGYRVARPDFSRK